MASELKQAEYRAGGGAPMLSRLRRVEEWRRARFRQLLDGPDRESAIRAARLYLEVGARRMAAERGLV
ncbi:hypothetical protein BEL01nite_38450 [Bradyrhizobium elkanii]|jgi:hypothetical protein|nr:hypothetical protein BEL01nite_38450 [Bradyrhizobium elkanii]